MEFVDTDFIWMARTLQFLIIQTETIEQYKNSMWKMI